MNWVLAPILLPLGWALLLAGVPAGARPRLGLWGGGLLAGAALVLLARVLEAGALSVALGGWPLPYGIESRADALSAALVAVAALLGLAVFTYDRALAGQPLAHALLASVCAVFLAADLFNLYVWFELALIATLGLLAAPGTARASEAAFKYLALNLLGTLALLVAVGGVYGVAGQLNFAALAGLAPARMAELSPFLALLVVALLLKAGALPLFAWLPASYPALGPAALALIGGLLTKVAAYVLLRLFGQVFPLLVAWQELLGWLALATMLAGVLGAAYHWDLRRILALHIVSQIGYLLLGVALASPAAATGTAFFLVHNILVKANLFLIAGLILAEAGHYDLRRIGGLYPGRPWLAVLFLVNALALVGVPPSSGFWGKFMLVGAAFEQDRLVWGLGALAVGLLTLYSMSKIWLEGFWKPAPDNAPAPRPPMPRAAWWASAGLSVLVLAMGLWPAPFITVAEQAVAGFVFAGGAP